MSKFIDGINLVGTWEEIREKLLQHKMGVRNNIVMLGINSLWDWDKNKDENGGVEAGKQESNLIITLTYIIEK